MSVVNVSKAWRGSAGMRSLQDKTYTVYYRVETDNANDGVRRVIEHFEDTPSLPFLGDIYQFEGPGIVEDAGVVLWKIEPTRDQASATVWLVALHYKTPDESGEGGAAGAGTDGVGEDEDGEATDDPVDFHGDLEVNFVDFTRPVDRAIYRGGFTNYAIETGLVDPAYIQPAEQLYGGLDSEGPVVNCLLYTSDAADE